MNYRGADKELQIDSLLFLYMAYNVDFERKLEAGYEIFTSVRDQCFLSVKDVKLDANQIKTVLEEQVELIEAQGSKNSMLKAKIQAKLGSLVYAIEFFNELKPLDPEKIIQIKESTVGTISNNNKKLLETYDGMIADYKELFTLLAKVDINDRSEDFLKLVTILLRPYQDIEKLQYYLPHKELKVDIELLDNPNRSHAEVNLVSFSEDDCNGKLMEIG